MLDVDQLMLELTRAEKAALLGGSNFWQTMPVPRLGIPKIMVSDGPHGLRAQPGDGDHLGVGDSLPATCFPTASAIASSWNPAFCTESGRRRSGGARHELVRHPRTRHQYEATPLGGIDAQVDERTLREIYLPASERVVTASQPWTVMCSYNKSQRHVGVTRPVAAAHRAARGVRVRRVWSSPTGAPSTTGWRH